ncbi:MAG: methyltransferase domain-containing protein [Candidatus Nanoarchaeia archaeon]
MSFPEIIPKYDLFGSLLDSLHKELEKKETLLIVDVGCGDKPYEAVIKNKLKDKCKKITYTGVDFYNSKADIDLDINKKKLPFKDNSADIVICTEVLEHTYNPFFVISEMKRILKKNGLLLVTSPFFFPVHEVEHDYVRFTHNFYRNHFKEHKILREIISNSALSFPLYLINYYLSYAFKTKFKTVKYFQKPFDWLALQMFKNRTITYSYYMDTGYLIKMKK